MSGGFPLRCRSKRVVWGHATWQSLMSTPIRKMISMASLGPQQGKLTSGRCIDNVRTMLYIHCAYKGRRIRCVEQQLRGRRPAVRISICV